MKFIIELNSEELISVINKGSLLALSEAAFISEEGAHTAAGIIKNTQPAPTLSPAPAQQYQQQPPIQQAPMQQPPMQQFPQQQQQPPVQQYQQQPPMQQYQQQPPMQQPPVAAPTYTIEQLAVAATQLSDAGRRMDLINLLASFGIQAMTELKPEQYGAFATQLRAMGAKI